MEKSKDYVKVLAQAALCAALCYVGATFIKIDIPVGTEKTMFHFGNTFCVLAALLVGGPWGGLAGAVGMTISDLTTSYVTSAPKTFFLKLCIGLRGEVTGTAHHPTNPIVDIVQAERASYDLFRRTEQAACQIIGNDSSGNATCQVGCREWTTFQELKKAGSVNFTITGKSPLQSAGCI